MTSFSFYILFLFWFVHIFRKTFFYLFFLQLKEYRFDRIFDSIKENKKILFSKEFFLVFLLFVFFLFPLETPFLIFFKIFSIFFFYCLFCLYAIFLLFQKKWKLPVFTKKMLFLSGGTFLFIFLNLYLFFNQTFLTLLILDLFLPYYLFFFNFCFQFPTRFLKQMAISKAKRKIQKMKNLIVIGITGSYGKTSTKEFLYTILSSKYSCLKTEKSINVDVGIANFLLSNLKPYHQVFICEMGAYKIGEIRKICRMVKPKIGILTGINEQHLSLFGSLENTIKAKYELIESLPSDGLAIFNGDNFYCRKLYAQTKIPKLIYKTQPPQNEDFEVDIWVEDIRIDFTHLAFLAKTKKEKADFFVNLLGAHNIQNLLAAISAAQFLGMTLSEISQACKKITQEAGNMILKKGKTINIIESKTRTINPVGVMAHLDYLELWQGKKITIMPCLIELGKESSKIHKALGEKIGKICDLAIITTHEKFEEIKEGVKDQCPIKLLKNPKKIFQEIKNFCQEGDVVLIEGRVSPEITHLLENL